MADDCKKHRGQTAATSPHLDQLMKALPENQSGSGRHKCTYCAYEAGFEAGFEAGCRHERFRIAKWLDVEPGELDN